MKPLRHCGICEELTHKEFCWRCTERGNRLDRAIRKKLQAKRTKR